MESLSCCSPHASINRYKLNCGCEYCLFVTSLEKWLSENRAPENCFGVIILAPRNMFPNSPCPQAAWVAYAS